MLPRWQLHPFTPEFSKWTLPYPTNLVISIVALRDFSQKVNNRMAISADPDETARYVWISTVCKDISISLQG